jgi:hypothetical protein
MTRKGLRRRAPDFALEFVGNAVGTQTVCQVYAELGELAPDITTSDALVLESLSRALQADAPTIPNQVPAAAPDQGDAKRGETSHARPRNSTSG